LDDLDRRILGVVQEHFPIDERPYLQIARQIGSTESEVIDRMQRLVDRGVIRDISPVFDLQKLGHCSTLAALDVPADRVDEVARIVNARGEVTHNYLREGRPNMWFTVIAESEAALRAILESIERDAKCGPVANFPAQRKFTARVVFELGDADGD
jgi:DNA-binding Lrp family transcriptional regulator